MKMHLFGNDVIFRCRVSKGVFIATQLNWTQLNWTQLNSTQLNWPSWTGYSQVSRVFVYDVITYKLSQLLFTLSSWVQLSWVELCRYKHPLCLFSSTTQQKKVVRAVVKSLRVIAIGTNRMLILFLPLWLYSFWDRTIYWSNVGFFAVFIHPSLGWSPRKGCYWDLWHESFTKKLDYPLMKVA